MAEQSKSVDLNALKFNQIMIVGLTVIGFAFDLRIVPALVAAILLLGAIDPGASLFRILYRHVIVPLKIMTPHVVTDSPAPHRFAQLLGGVTLGIGAVLLYSGSLLPGWSLAWVVILLASANIFLGFCAGCFLYLHLSRLVLRGHARGDNERIAPQ